ncbi:MAG: hypothetical protein C4523_04370 [Myxococcales bacterium]|nr:MAG: hypothetical protein C4523_04370 [Myxococcales bacterium]
MAAFDLSRVNSEIRKRLEPFLADFTKIADFPFQAAYLIGPAARGEFNASKPELQICLVADSYRPETLEAIASLGRKHGKAGIRAPLLLTPEHIQQARDVFPMSLLDLKHNHIPLAGVPLLDGIAISQMHLRWECEREARLARLHMRQAYLSSAGDAAWMARWFADEVVLLFPIFRAVLHLLGEEAKSGNTESAERLSEKTGVPLESFVAVWALRKTGKTPAVSAVKQLYVEWDEAMRQLIGKIDALPA